MPRIILPLLGLLGILPALAPSAPLPRSSDWVTLRGQMVWPESRRIPELKELGPDIRDAEFFKKHGPQFDEKLLVNEKNRGIRNVMVWLRPDTEDRNTPFPKDRIHPDWRQAKPKKHSVLVKCCQFEPRVLTLRDGDTISFQNQADIAHAIVLYPNNPENAELSRILQPQKGVANTEPLHTEKGPLQFKCPLHPWMVGYVRIFDHPYHAVTGADGRFEIPKVPVGKWRITYWHEIGCHAGLKKGCFGFPITIRDEGEAVMSLPPVEYDEPL